MKRTLHLASVLPSEDTNYTPSRYAGPANPTGDEGANTRARASLSSNGSPTVMNPKLNTKPWSTSYAVHRTQPRNVKRRSRGLGRRKDVGGTA